MTPAIFYVTNWWLGAGLIVAVLAFVIWLQGRQIRARERECYEAERRRKGVTYFGGRHA